TDETLIWNRQDAKNAEKRRAGFSAFSLELNPVIDFLRLRVFTCHCPDGMNMESEISGFSAKWNLISCANWCENGETS
ncbi:MAG TPA: hypothetical protein VMB80_14375, partial [Candidatus Acidoferrum sp.]|nr:hypothetical protein [Candidatus Acidoferrum sp.]